MQLKDFPRPKNDNGIGMHFALDNRDSDLDAFVPVLNAMRVKWIVFYAGDELQTERCARRAWAQGAMPIIRPKGKIGQNIPWEAHVQKCLLSAPAAYVQIFNEPGNQDEWKLTGAGLSEMDLSAKRNAEYSAIRSMGLWAYKKSRLTYSGSYNRDQLVQLWNAAAERVVNAGGYPGIQSMDRDETRAILSASSQRVRERTWFASHAYLSNHPPDYPYDARNQQDHPGATVFDDDTCQLRFIEEVEWCKSALGFYPPVIVTEGGAVMEQQEDNRYPRTDAMLHKTYSVATYDQFRGRLANGAPLSDYLFAYCSFLIHDTDFHYFSWLDVAPETIEAVKQMPPFIRQSSWDVNPIPPLPQTNEKLPIGPYCISLDDLKPDPKTWSDQAKESAILVMTPVNVEKLQQVVDSCHPLILARYYNEKYGLVRPRENLKLHFQLQSAFASRILASPQSAALELFNDMRPDIEKLRSFGKVIWMGLNEPDSTTREKCQALNAMTVEWARLMHGAGVECGAYALGEGNPPDLTWWKDLEPGIIACNYNVFDHEYAGSDFASSFPWHIGRFTLMLPQLSEDTQRKIKIFIGESGCDRAIVGFPQEGWVKQFSSMKEYIQKVLQPLADLIAKYPQVKACITFAAAWGTAPSFNVGDQPDYMKWIASLPDRIIPEPSPPVNDVDIAIQAEARHHLPLFNFDPTLALMRDAKPLRAPMTDEYRVTVFGVQYIAQNFTDGIRYCRVGDWGNIKLIGYS